MKEKTIINVERLYERDSKKLDVITDLVNLIYEINNAETIYDVRELIKDAFNGKLDKAIEEAANIDIVLHRD